MKNKIQKLIAKYGTENFLFANKVETFYLTGASFDGFWILILNGGIYIICSKMIENQVKEFFKDKYKIITGASFSKAAVEARALSGDVKKIIADPKYMTAADFLLFENRLKAEGIELSAKMGVLDDLRIVKSVFEIENLRQSCRIASEVCNEIKLELKAGLTELDVHYRILELFAKRKVKESFTPIVAAGINAANPHHASSNYKIAENDAVMLDIGCFYNGYASDLTRTFYLGRINVEFKRIWDIVKEAQNAAIKQIKAGTAISCADKAARDIINSYGYKDNFIHTTGHGVGIEIHEMPSLAINAEGVFLAGMTVTAEPGVYIEGKFGVRIEDTVLINENACEILTSAAYQ
ncbi:MAG: aminopeptidase P family protein [Endomicrobium sp.]|jgi:Xaa-Pro aminopeptidase|nr:aminopeptidase P family protein [Endomicrobium sp.]